MRGLKLYRLSMRRIKIGTPPGRHPVLHRFYGEWAIFPNQLFQSLHHRLVIGLRCIGRTTLKNLAVLGAQFPRPKRGLLSRPGVDQVMAYRQHVDQAMERLFERQEPGPELAAVIELGRMECGRLISSQRRA